MNRNIPEEFYIPFVFVNVHILVDALDPVDIKQVSELQDNIKTEAASAKIYNSSNFNQESYKAAYGPLESWLDQSWRIGYAQIVK